MAKLDWSKARPILARVLEAPEPEQERVLVEACAGDAELLAGLRELLEAERELTRGDAPDFGRALAGPGAGPGGGPGGGPGDTIGADPGRPVASGAPGLLGAVPGSGVASGTRIGAWRLECLIGRGGMGAVWLASRADGAYDQQVALKIATGALGSSDIVARFEQERSLLARLEHGGIARIIDGGTTDDGAPFFALEYVDGERIDRFADAHELSIRERVVLFVRALRAVEYAHERGLVHRDLKPANLLVTEAGEPKLLDFGIAKLVEGDASASLTGSGERMMTPRFASPEQVLGEPVTPAADVYALGVMLFGLLTGEWTHDVPSRILDVQRAICEEQPRNASEAVPADPAGSETAALRRTTRAELVRELAGDLDWILAKALRKVPEDRYTSARLFAEDLQRYLGSYPVLARPASRSYRLRKFVRRNRRLVVGTAVALVLIAVASGIGLGHKWRAAEAEAARHARIEDLRTSGRELLRVANQMSLQPGQGPAQLELVQIGLRDLEAERADPVREPAVVLEVASGFLMMSNVLCSRGGVSLGRAQAAAEAIEHGRGLYEAVLTAHPENEAAAAGQVAALTRLAEVHVAEREFDRAHALAQEAVELASAWLAQPPAPEATRYMLHAGSNAELVLAEVEQWQGELRSALEHVERAAELGRDVPEAGESSVAFHEVRGTVLRALGDYEGACEAFATALERLEASATARPDDGRLRASVAGMRAVLGRALVAARRYPEAREMLAEALGVVRVLLEFDRTNRAAHSQLLQLVKALGMADLRTGDMESALARWEEAGAICDEAAARWPEDDGLRAERALVPGLIGQTLVTAGDFERAEDPVRRAIELTEAHLDLAPGDRAMAQNLATYHGLLGHLLLQLGRVEEAHEAVERYYDFSVADGDRHPEEAWSRVNVLIAVDNYGGARFELGKQESRPRTERIEHLERALELYAESIDRARGLMQEGLIGPEGEEGIRKTEESLAECEEILAGLEAGE